MLDNELIKSENEYKRAKQISLISIPIYVIGGILCFVLVLLNYWYISSLLFFALIIYVVIVECVKNHKATIAKKVLGECINRSLRLSQLKYTNQYDDMVYVKSSRAVDDFTDLKYIKEPGRAQHVIMIGRDKREYQKFISNFLWQNNFKNYSFYPMYEQMLKKNLENTNGYTVLVSYSSPTGKVTKSRTIHISQNRIMQFENDKSLTMTKTEYNKYLKEQAKGKLDSKHHKYYDRVNRVIDYANNTKDELIVKTDEDRLDKLISSIFDRTINSINKIKTIDSEEWGVIDNYINTIESDITEINSKNKKLRLYYESNDFAKIKNICADLMDSQKEFNEYIELKVASISALFGTNIVRNETIHEDDFNYIHPYKKTITPFTAEVSASVFASAENSPLDYIVKYFYPNKERYPEQIQKLHQLIEELETLKDAKVIIDEYKSQIHQYLNEVPDFVMELDEDGFYSRLGFAVINEDTLTVDYKFSYTSGSGKAQRSFTVPMTEDTIVELIHMLESKLTMSAFKKEQRLLMTGKLRQAIKERDNYTCKICGNSIYDEPNLLLEIDHIIPVAKGGVTEESNLQTLCWKCNRTKGAKIIDGV